MCEKDEESEGKGRKEERKKAHTVLASGKTKCTEARKQRTSSETTQKYIMESGFERDLETTEEIHKTNGENQTRREK